ncbi:hypothetical protein J437_LFUL016902, partial [Ladona fulva]
KNPYCGYRTPRESGRRYTTKLQKNWRDVHVYPILQEERHVFTLRYLTTSALYKHLMGASSVGKIIKETVEALWNVLHPLHIPMPTEKNFENIAKDFNDMWNYPNCVGCIDRKNDVADSYCRFVTIKYAMANIHWGTFHTSGMYQMLQDGTLKIPKDKCLLLTNKEVPFLFLGDDAYPLLEHLMKPYNDENLLPDEVMYNKRHSRARKSVEFAFGILYSK